MHTFVCVYVYVCMQYLFITQLNGEGIRIKRIELPFNQVIK